MARRGKPKVMRSDCGTNLVRVEKELREAAGAWNDDGPFQAALANDKIQWRFNPPGAPHTGGVWERQIPTVKRIIQTTVGDQVLDDDRLLTLFCEIEHVVNSRPITAVPNETGEPEGLYPAQLLQGTADPAPTPGPTDITLAYQRRWGHAQWLADQFWKRWLWEYLPLLRRRQKERRSQVNIQVGDVVLVTGEQTVRNQWPLARVTHVYPSDDDFVRKVSLRTARRTLIRAPSQLCLLEGVTA